MIDHSLQPDSVDTPNSREFDVAVVGGGAAGFFAAIRCASLNPALRVALLEGTRRPLTKVKISGGGRCNVTHYCFDPKELVKNYPRGSRELLGAFSRFQPQDTVRWFKERGVDLKVEADGRMFPTTDDSQTVIDCLNKEARKYKIEIRLGALVKSVKKFDNAFVMQLPNECVVKAKKLLLATGSFLAAYDLAKAMGHSIERLVPSLFTFNVLDPRLVDLAGLSFPQVSLQLGCSEEKPMLCYPGPLLITHWGLSGPAVLKLSAFGAVPLFDQGYQADLLINFLFDASREQVLKELMLFKELQHRKLVLRNIPDSLAQKGIPRRFWERLVFTSGMKDTTTWAEAGKKHLSIIAEELTNGRYKITGKGVFKEEFVTCGGVALNEIDFRTMASRIDPNLCFAGEVLNIDGITGGFNFQNAWTTGWIAGSYLAGES